MESLPKLITKEEMIDKFKDEKQYSNWIALKLKSKTYKKIRNNLYALIDPSTNDIYSTKFEIASKISNTSFICYHSALEYYGLANQVFGDVLVGTVIGLTVGLILSNVTVLMLKRIEEGCFKFGKMTKASQ